MQPKLLRVLQDGEFEPLGRDNAPRQLPQIVASNQDLKTAIRAGRFRQDLYYRLSVFPIEVPPLRDRCDDIPLLVRYFAKKYARRMGRQIESIAKQTMDALSQYTWPGNIRELQNLMERAV